VFPFGLSNIAEHPHHNTVDGVIAYFGFIFSSSLKFVCAVKQHLYYKILSLKTGEKSTQQRKEYKHNSFLNI